MTPYLLFDFDGTIADSFSLGVQILNELAPRFHIDPFSESELHELRSMPTHQAIKRMNIPLYKIPILVPVFLHEFKRVIPMLKPFPDIKETLLTLKDMGIPMALITSNSLENVSRFIEQHQLHFFDWIEGGSGLFNKQTTIRKQIKRHNLNIEDIIYVGDETRDIVASKKCKIKIISVLWGFQTAQILRSYNPDFYAHTPLDLVQIIKGLQLDS